MQKLSLDVRTHGQTAAYTAPMRKHTTLDLDMELVREAADVLGTTRINETVHGALAEVVRRRHRSWLAAHDFAELTPEGLEELRAGRAPRPVG